MKASVPSTGAPGRERSARWRIVCAGSLAFGLTAVVVANSLSWIGSTVPGFFVLPNRVVSAVSLPGWPTASTLFGKEVLGIAGVPPASAEALYEYARHQPPGTDIEYKVRSADGAVDEVRWQTRVFSVADYASLFGVYLLCGIVSLYLPAVVWRFHCHRAAIVALASSSAICGVYFITAIDRHDPHWFFRLHLMAEALAVAALLHLAAAFPIDRLGRRPEWTLPFLYLPALLFGLVYQASVWDAVMYEQFHLAANVALVACATALAATILHGSFRAHSILTQRRSALAGFGVLVIAAAAVFLTISSDSPQSRTLLDNAAAVSFLLPLCIAYAAAKEGSFAIDSALRRALAYTLLLAVLASSYVVLSWLSNDTTAENTIIPSSPLVFTLVVFCFVLGAAALRDRVQALTDRFLFGKRYQVEQALSALSRSLASTHTIDAVDTQIRNVLAQTIRPNHANLFLRCDDGTFRALDESPEHPSPQLPAWRVARLERNELQSRQEEEAVDGCGEESSGTGLDAGLLVPIGVGSSLQAVLALGGKESGRSYNAGDMRFLRAAAMQIALALRNATGLQESRELAARLEDLSEGLERQVDERTAALHTSNRELNRSLEKLQYAYVKLEQSQANLLRSDRLATLGRLTAGLAHEMNTPLSAVLNSLKLMRDLSEEYRSSIDDPGVLPEDHHEIAAELIAQAKSATEWANKAAAFIRSVKAQGREAGAGPAQRFAIRDVVADARGLVAHRLRATSCRIDLVEEPNGITLDGDPSRFNQVLVNLVTNAIDAYEDRGIDDASIEIRAWQENDSVCVQVRDWAGGIPTSILPHIFDELYTTKGPGRGTGLGLWISRNIVEEALGGTLDVITNSEGSCFLAQFPQVREESAPIEADRAKAA